ncbi:MAG: TetR family transcriptional regulator [Peptococcaceae bacterium]|jgi:AcrR family transcriptional regulator|nr:TetR family transcriptional regulator [Peptococcaceae bacterium]
MSHANKALFTKQAMYHALKKLITTKSINKITIKDITDTCGLNRQTFYYHFKDIYDLLEWSFQEEFRFIDSYLQKPEYTWEEIFAGSVKYISQNKYICQCIVCGLARDQLILSLHNSIYEIVRKIILRSLPQNQIPEKYLDFTARFYTYALSNYLFDWVKNGMLETPEEVIDNFIFVVNHSLNGKTEANQELTRPKNHPTEHKN